MKNVHILPTDQASRLVKINSTLFFGKNEREMLSEPSLDIVAQHIYITSDELFKENDWVLNTDTSELYKADADDVLVDKKDIDWYADFNLEVIMTNDPTLISDGVQAIDNDFLKWFVKNPTCEFVEVKRNYLSSKCLKCGFIENHDEVDTEDCPKCHNTTYEHLYKNEIIIAQEEQKQHLINIMHDDEELGLYEEPKQETLEEAADKWVFETNGHKWSNNDDTAGDNYGSFIAGANYQAENMFSEEEVDLLVNELINKFTDWSGSYVYKDKLIEMCEQLKKK
jgi:hypothetical protein